jgi:hypothetical protein
MNDFSQISSESEFRNEITVTATEVPAIDAHLEMDFEDRVSGQGGDMEENAGWPGDGSGTDDFADYNQNEAADYAGE